MSRGEPDVRNKGLIKVWLRGSCGRHSSAFDDGLAGLKTHCNEIERELIATAWREQ